MNIFKKIFKKNLSENDFMNLLLNESKTITNSFEKLFIEKFKFKGNKKHLKIEISILSLWIITLGLKSKEEKDILHHYFCKKMGMNKDQYAPFYDELINRYDNYSIGFEKFNKNNSKGGISLGKTILNTLTAIKKNDDPSNIFECLALFIANLHATTNFINGIKEDFNITN